MKKKLGVLILIVGITLSLSACGKKPAAKDAVDAYINAELFLKDFDRYEKIFGEKVDKNSESFLKADFAEQVQSLGVTKAESDKIMDGLLETIGDKISFTLKTVKEEQKTATVEVAIKSLDMTKFATNTQALMGEKILKSIKEAGVTGVEGIADLTKLTSEADLNKVNEIIEEVTTDPAELTPLLIDVIAKMETVTAEKTLTVTLIENPAHKKYWQVDKQDEVLEELTQSVMSF